LLEEYKKWIECRSQSKYRLATAFSKTKQVWLMIHPYAVQVKGNTRIEWSDYGHTLSYNDPGCRRPFNVGLSSFVIMVQQLVANARDLYKSFLPQGYEPPSVDISVLRDNGSLGQSVFEQESNRAIFTHFVDDFYNVVLCDVQRTRQEFHSQEQKLLQAILVAVSMTIGVPPRTFQLAGMLYKADEGNCCKRNLYIRKGVVVLGWPRSKSFKSIYQASLWALPEVLGELIIHYLGVIRPASIKLLQRNNIDVHEDLNTCIFVFTKSLKSKRCTWSTTHVNSILKAATGPKINLELSLPRLRQVMTAIYRKHFPAFIQATPFKTLIAYGGGHPTHVNVFHNFFGSSVSLSDESVSCYIEVSRVLQGALRMLPNGCGIFASIKGQSDRQISRNQAFALDQARWMIGRSSFAKDQSFIAFPPEPVRYILICLHSCTLSHDCKAGR
jgi:hypothetical protein